MSKTPQHLIKEAIAIFGTEQGLADIAGVSQPYINRAKHTGQIGPKLALAIHKATKGKVSKAALRPDLWGEQ